MEMPGGLQGGGGDGGCGTPGFWLIVIGWTPATLTACSQCSQSQWEKPKHEAHVPKMRDTQTDDLNNCMYLSVCLNSELQARHDIMVHAVKELVQSTYFTVCTVCVWECGKSVCWWAHYRGDNSAVGSLRGDCVQESRWKQSWSNASFSTQHRPTDPGERGRGWHTRLLQKHNFNHIQSSLIFYTTHGLHSLHAYCLLLSELEWRLINLSCLYVRYEPWLV